MSLPVTTEPLPSSYTWGKIVGRVVHLIADTAEDTDDKPQARAAAGKVTFTPKEVLRKTTEADYPAIVLHKAESATLSGSGRILDAEGRQGIWLAAGVYTVTFDIKDAARAIPQFDIQVTTEHTDATPLDLATVVPYVPPTGTVVQTVLVPAGGTDGQVLVRAADGGLAWADQGGAVDSVNGQTGAVVLTAADVGALTTDEVDPLVATYVGDGTSQTGVALRAASVAAVKTAGEIVTDEFFRLTLVGTADGGQSSDTTPRITIQSWQSPHNPGRFGEGLRLDVMDPLAKNMLAWRMPVDGTLPYDETTNPLRSVVWMGAHYYSRDGVTNDIVHGHWSLEVPDAAGLLQTRLEVRIIDKDTGAIGVDHTNIITNLADFTVRANGSGGVLRIAGDDAFDKSLELGNDIEGLARRWRLRAAAGAGADFYFESSAGGQEPYIPALVIQRGSNRMSAGGAGIVASAAFALGWSTPGDRGFVAMPTFSTGASAAFAALMQVATDRTIDLRLAADVTPRLEIDASGKMQWGPGSGGRDVNLYRSAANILATDDDFEITAIGKGPIMKSPDGTRYRLSVANGGAVSAVAA